MFYTSTNTIDKERGVFVRNDEEVLKTNLLRSRCLHGGYLNTTAIQVLFPIIKYETVAL